MEPQQNHWSKWLVDLGPLIAFLICLFVWDIFVATAVLIVTTVLATGTGYILTRKIAPMPLVTLVVVSIFGGLSLWLQDDSFIKMKPTIVMGLFSVVLFGGLLVDRPLVKYVMSAALSLDDAGWRKLTFRFAIFFAAIAVLNELVWRTQSDEVWGLFKGGIFVLNVLFILTQIPLIRRHQVEES